MNMSMHRVNMNPMNISPMNIGMGMSPTMMLPADLGYRPRVLDIWGIMS